MDAGPNTDAAYCYHRAEENRQSAARQTDAERKAPYLDLEARWIKLALSYEYSGRASATTAHLACRLDQPERD